MSGELTTPNDTESRCPLTPPWAQARIPTACAWSGLNRSRIYAEHAAGRLLFRKHGRATLVDGASLAKLIADLPTA